MNTATLSLRLFLRPGSDGQRVSQLAKTTLVSLGCRIRQVSTEEYSKPGFESAILLIARASRDASIGAFCELIARGGGGWEQFDLHEPDARDAFWSRQRASEPLFDEYVGAASLGVEPDRDRLRLISR